MNTMKDLRREVASRMRTALHGREIDMVEEIKPKTPHMLGITPLNKVHDPKNEEMTLLDPKHHFWDEYTQSVDTKATVSEAIQTAIQSLKEDDIFRMTYPYGEEAEVVYVEVDRIPDKTGNNMLQTSCKRCGHTLTAPQRLQLTSRSYYLSVSLDCPECDFETDMRTKLQYNGT